MSAKAVAAVCDRRTALSSRAGFARRCSELVRYQ